MSIVLGAGVFINAEGDGKDWPFQRIHSMAMQKRVKNFLSAT